MPARRRAAQLVWVVALASVGCLPAEAAEQAPGDQPTDFTLGSIAFLGDGPNLGIIGIGAFNFIPNNEPGDNTAAELRLEYRYGSKWKSIGPMIGIMGNSDGGVFGFAALYTDMRVADHWIVTPAAGIGAYEAGDGTDLGGTFQFHLGLDVSYRFNSGSRLGLKIAHISNAGLNDDNPGTESVLVTYMIPLGSAGRFGR